MSDLWYYAEGKSTKGPLSLVDLGEFLARKSDGKAVLVWRHGFEGWCEVAKVPELETFLAKPPPIPNPVSHSPSALSPSYQQTPPPSVAAGLRFGVLRAIGAGEYGLGKTFWGAYVAGCVGALLLGALIIAVFIALRMSTIGFILSFLVTSSYWMVASLGVWNSAAVSIRSPIWLDRLWGYAARLVVLAFILNFLFRLANGGALRLLARMTAPINF